MNGSVAISNMLLGWVYMAVGVLTIIDMKRGWKTMGFSPFGAALVALAFTCGPHHVDHGLHVWYGRAAGPLDLAAVVAGFPPGAAFVWLRLEAFFGGRGDRFVSANTLWVRCLPFLSAVYLTALVSSLTDEVGMSMRFGFTVVVNSLLVLIYLSISYVLLRTQIHNRAILGGWSLSGLSLGTLFWTCAAMHTVTAVYTASARYDTDIHGVLIDTLSVPAGIYFLWVTWGLYRDAIGDWHRDRRRARVLVPTNQTGRAAA